MTRTILHFLLHSSYCECSVRACCHSTVRHCVPENEDVSSISGSESDSESELSSVTETDELPSDERVSHLLARRAKLLFENQDGQMISVYQCLLHNKKVSSTITTVFFFNLWVCDLQLGST